MWRKSETFKLPDHMSRLRDRSDYKLNQSAFEAIEAWMGPHTIDAFADHTNAKLQLANFRYPHKEAYAVDTLAQRPTASEQRTTYKNVYMCQPFGITAQAISWADSNLVHDYTMVVPEWPSQFWWPMVTARAVDWLPLESSPTLFVSSSSGHRPMVRATWRVFAVRMRPLKPSKTPSSA